VLLNRIVPLLPNYRRIARAEGSLRVVSPQRGHGRGRLRQRPAPPGSCCRVVNAVRPGLARHCRAHPTTRLAVLWTAVPTFKGPAESA
jgi:hypothetical protein